MRVGFRAHSPPCRRWHLARLRQIEVGDVSVSTLSVEDEFLYLCLHADKHGVLNRFGLSSGKAPEWFASAMTGNRLTWFLDVHLFLKKYGDELDWDAVNKQAQRWNILAEVPQHFFRKRQASCSAYS